MRITYQMYTGKVNKDLTVRFCYNLETEGDFRTIYKKDNGDMLIRPSYSFTISEGFQKNWFFIANNHFNEFKMLLSKSVKLVSDNIYVLFPKINSLEFDIDSKALARFQTEKALEIDGMSCMPCVYSADGNNCFPAIRITTNTNKSITIPFEDAISLSELLNNIEPNVFGITLLATFGPG